jgi:hypothetical protein
VLRRSGAQAREVAGASVPRQELESDESAHAPADGAADVSALPGDLTGSRRIIGASSDVGLGAGHRHLARVAAHRDRPINFWRTLIRHATARAVGARVVAVVLPAVRSALVSRARRPLLCGPRLRPAAIRAVHLPSIVAAA